MTIRQYAALYGIELVDVVIDGRALVRRCEDLGSEYDCIILDAPRLPSVGAGNASATRRGVVVSWWYSRYRA